MKPCEAFLKTNGFFFSPCLGQMYSNLNSVKSEDSYRLSRESHPLFHKSASFLFDFLISKGKGMLFLFFFFSLTLTLMLQLLFDSQEHKHWLQEQLKLHQEPKYKMKGCGVGNGRKWYCWNSPLKFPKWCLICGSLKAAAIPLVSKWSFFLDMGAGSRDI